MAGSHCDPLAILKCTDTFSLLPPRALRDLASLARVERYHKRTLLVGQGRRPEHIRYILEGYIDLLLATPDGRSTALPLFAGSWATWLGCISEKPLPHEMWSSKSAVFLAIPRQQARAEILNNEAALLSAIEHIGDSNRFLVSWTLGASLQKPEKRLAHMLAVLARTIDPVAPLGAEMPITQDQIGQLGFGSRQRVGRLLTSLARRGLIETSYGTISIPVWQKLNAFALE